MSLGWCLSSVNSERMFALAWSCRPKKSTWPKELLHLQEDGGMLPTYGVTVPRLILQGNHLVSCQLCGLEEEEEEGEERRKGEGRRGKRRKRQKGRRGWGKGRRGEEEMRERRKGGKEGGGKERGGGGRGRGETGGRGGRWGKGRRGGGGRGGREEREEEGRRGEEGEGKRRAFPGCLTMSLIYKKTTGNSPASFCTVVWNQN